MRIIHRFSAALALLAASSPMQAAETQLLAAFSALEGHINGTSPLTGTQIAGHKLTIDANSTIFGDTANTISASFDLVAAYEAQYGPMWSAGSPTQNGFSRSTASDQDIHWTMFHVMQNIVDDTYNPANIATHQALLNGYKFGSADVVPGPVNTTTNPSTFYNVTIDASFPDDYGRNTMHWAEADRNKLQATGAYLAPGEMTTIAVPASLVNSGYKIRVGPLWWDLSNKNPVDRLDRTALVYDITSTTTQVASPLGGNIYIEVPFEAASGDVPIYFDNVSRAPFYSMQDHDQTTLSEWQNTERNHAAPWTDIQTEKFMLTVPTGWVYAMSDPKSMLEDWDTAMDITNQLMGFPTDRGKVTLYEAVDVRIRAAAYAPGYPTVNTTYDPLYNQDASSWNSAGNAYNGMSSNHLVNGPHITGSHVLFHELGHAYLFPKLPGEVESVVNLLHVPVFHQGFGYDIDTAFRASRGSNNSYQTLDTTAINWMTSFNFFTRKLPMDKLEKQYQLKGHAKFVEVARMFGWDKLGDYYATFNDDFETLGYTPNYDIDDHLLRLSEAVGEDVTPLFHFWGVHPLNLEQLQSDLDVAGVAMSRKVFELLQHYKSIVPEDNAAFRQHAVSWWGREPDITRFWTEHEHARQWDATDLSAIPYHQNEGGFTVPLQLPNGEMYTEDSAALIRETIDDLIFLYFLEFIADLNEDDVLDGADWIIFRDNIQADMTGLTAEQAWALGDLDGDLDNDIEDFDLFRRAYESANPQPGAFQAMVESTVPEPGSLVVLLGGLVAGCSRRRRRGQNEVPTDQAIRSNDA